MRGDVTRMLRRKKRNEIWASALKLGLFWRRCVAVAKIFNQFWLSSRSIDGHFGYLTQEALRFFQRDFRLRIDGIVFRSFWFIKETNLQLDGGFITFNQVKPWKKYASYMMLVQQLLVGKSARLSLILDKA